MLRRGRHGFSSAGVAIVVLILGLAAVSTVYVSSTQSSASQLSSQSEELATLKSQVLALVASGTTGKPNATLPVMNQVPTIRTLRETWYLSPAAHQDRFDPAFIIVNQGDTVHMTFIDNDTVAHDFVVGPPYNIIVNATVKGLINDLTGVTFTTNATNNSPGVVVKGSPGSVTADYSFVAKFSGIFEFVCTYHAQVGMIGYLVVLPNAAYTSTATTTQSSAGGPASNVTVNIIPGAWSKTSDKGFSPYSITVVIGVNNTVQWINNDSVPHTVTADDGSFNGILAAGASYTYTFASPGVFLYHCTYHPWMTGTVTVKQRS